MGGGTGGFEGMMDKEGMGAGMGMGGMGGMGGMAMGMGGMAMGMGGMGMGMGGMGEFSFGFKSSVPFACFPHLPIASTRWWSVCSIGSFHMNTIRSAGRSCQEVRLIVMLRTELV